jgi:hypothetical protein
MVCSTAASRWILRPFALTAPRRLFPNRAPSCSVVRLVRWARTAGSMRSGKPRRPSAAASGVWGQVRVPGSSGRVGDGSGPGSEFGIGGFRVSQPHSKIIRRATNAVGAGFRVTGFVGAGMWFRGWLPGLISPGRVDRRGPEERWGRVDEYVESAVPAFVLDGAPVSDAAAEPSGRRFRGKNKGKWWQKPADAELAVLNSPWIPPTRAAARRWRACTRPCGRSSALQRDARAAVDAYWDGHRRRAKDAKKWRAELGLTREGMGCRAWSAPAGWGTTWRRRW